MVVSSTLLRPIPTRQFATTPFVYLIDCLLVPAQSLPILWMILVLIITKLVYSSVSYQWVIDQKDDRHGYESLSKHGPLVLDLSVILVVISKDVSILV